MEFSFRFFVLFYYSYKIYYLYKIVRFYTIEYRLLFITFNYISSILTYICKICPYLLKLNGGFLTGIMDQPLFLRLETLFWYGGRNCLPDFKAALSLFFSLVAAEARTGERVGRQDFYNLLFVTFYIIQSYSEYSYAYNFMYLYKCIFRLTSQK